MRIFVIVDSSKRKAKPIGALFWEAGGENGQGTFSLELSSTCDESRLPLSLAFCANRERRRATPDESADWVISRIVPENRHNIAEVLAANNLAEYDRVSLLAACKGRSSDDDLLAYEIELPEAFTVDPGTIASENPATPDAAGPQTPSAADRVIETVERQRTGAGIRYALVRMDDGTNTDGQPPSSHSEPHMAETPSTAAQRIGALIRNERRSQGLTQRQLAARAGITQTVLSRVESGAGNPTLSLLEELAAALGMRLDILLDAN